MNLKNLVYTELTGTPYTDSDVSITVQDGSVFPATPFEATIYNKRKNPGLAKNDGQAEIVDVTDIIGNTLTIVRAQGDTLAIDFGSAIDWAIIQGATKAVFDSKEDADATILKEADIVNDLTTGGTTVPPSAETVKTLNTVKMEGSFKQFYDSTQYSRGVDFSAGDDLVSITDLTVGRTYEIDFFNTVVPAGTDGMLEFEVAVRHDSVNYNLGQVYAYRNATVQQRPQARTRYTFVATAVTASIRCVTATGSGLRIQYMNCIVREYINMPESTSIGMTGL